MFNFTQQFAINCSHCRMCPSLKKRLLSAYNLDNIASIQWGIVHESVALETYKKMTGVQVNQTGDIFYQVLIKTCY